MAAYIKWRRGAFHRCGYCRWVVCRVWVALVIF
jgi:hypothetical protein